LGIPLPLRKIWGRKYGKMWGQAELTTFKRLSGLLGNSERPVCP
jgi:hypothetical protein